MNIIQKFFSIVFIILAPICSYSKELKIVSTIKPIYDIVNAITRTENNYGNDDGYVNYLLTGSNSIHNYHLKPGNYKALNDSDVIFLIDDNFEFYLNKILANINNDSQKIIRLSQIPGLKILKSKTTASNCLDHEHSINDYHIWLDIDNAIIITNYIKDILITKNPEKQTSYTENSNDFIAKLQSLDAQISNKLANYSHINYLVTHDAYQYFETKYNLRPANIVSYDHSLNISLKKIRDLKNLIREKNIHCVITDSKYPIANLKKSLNVPELKFFIADAEWINDFSFDSYYHMIESIADNMQKCFD